MAPRQIINQKKLIIITVSVNFLLIVRYVHDIVFDPKKFSGTSCFKTSESQSLQELNKIHWTSLLLSKHKPSFYHSCINISLAFTTDSNPLRVGWLRNSHPFSRGLPEARFAAFPFLWGMSPASLEFYHHSGLSTENTNTRCKEYTLTKHLHPWGTIPIIIFI